MAADAQSGDDPPSPVAAPVPTPAAGPNDTTVIDPGEPATAPGADSLQEGLVKPAPEVGDLATPVAKGKDRTKNGAVAAFSSYSAWLIGSPAAASDAAAALDAVASDLLNPAVAQTLLDIDRSGDNHFAVEVGAYRVIAHSGDDAAPDQVMVEIAAPLTIAGATRWAVVGGVVQWTEAGWDLVSIAPREVPQPAGKSSVDDLSDAERAATLEGLGWQSFDSAS
ncbi:hypothetical protein [Aeromicrobium sp. Sec7.5]|uniref:hypothetical protein n=1 Tax=Aeromicrobium sp. Sec7.5 TaxID=3121276 RepID=UPI002FE455C4